MTGCVGTLNIENLNANGNTVGDVGITSATENPFIDETTYNSNIKAIQYEMGDLIHFNSLDFDVDSRIHRPIESWHSGEATYRGDIYFLGKDNKGIDYHYFLDLQVNYSNRTFDLIEIKTDPSYVDYPVVNDITGNFNDEGYLDGKIFIDYNNKRIETDVYGRVSHEKIIGLFWNKSNDYLIGGFKAESNRR